MKKIYLLNIFCVLLFSCTQKIILEYEITSPRNSWTYYENQEIFFSTDLLSDNLQWISSKDGFLSDKPSFYMNLSKGHHIITLINKSNNKTKIVEIDVFEEKNKINQILLLNYPYNLNEPVKKGGFYSLNGEIKNLQTNIKEKEQICNINNCIRDISINSSLKNKKRVLSFSRQSTINYNTNQFFIINTNNQNSASKINSRLISSDDKLDFYVEDSFSGKSKEINNINICIDRIRNIIYPRVTNLWGEIEDINNDGKLTILFSSTINKEGVAVGFFNQSDFFANEKNANSKSYNPYSNERDIIYISIPNEENRNYTISSICATVAHEMTHAINFSKKTYIKIKENKEYSVMETFLDEGLSHLTENLVGFGISGGNKDFINAYLKNSNNISFCAADVSGQEDSVERRGAMSLFLFYLFEKAGGFEWQSNKVNYIDKGGITFLRKIIQSDDYNWNSIGEFFNRNTDFLFQDFCIDCINNNLSEIFDFSVIDPLTNENLFLCNEFSAYDISAIRNLVKYSITIINPINYEYQIDCDSYIGNNYFLYLVE